MQKSIVLIALPSLIKTFFKSFVRSFVLSRSQSVMFFACLFVVVVDC